VAAARRDSQLPDASGATVAQAWTCGARTGVPHGAESAGWRFPEAGLTGRSGPVVPRRGRLRWRMREEPAAGWALATPLRGRAYFACGWALR